jgi:intracellular multiplication protein IcmX
MKHILVKILAIMSMSLPAFADYVPNYEPSGENSQNLSSIQQDLVNLGGYLGYILGTAPSNVSDTLLDYSSSTSNQEVYEQAALIALFGALPVDTIQSVLTYFIPPTATNSSTLNNLANLTSTNYGTPSQNTFSAVVNIDAPAASSSSYLDDPTSQAVLNILTTNDYSVCNAAASSSSSSSSNAYPISTSTCVSQSSAMQTLLNSSATQSNIFPGVTSFGSYNYVQPFIGQLNANVLLAPLMYTNNSASSSSSSSNSSNSSSSNSANGLPSSSQADQAADFVRYAIGVPQGLSNYSNYLSIWQTAFPSGTGSVSANQAQATAAAQSALAAYLVNLRTFAARSSAAIGNLYYLLSKRMPQTNSTTSNSSSGSSSSNNQTSQELSEFQMATWRIYNMQNSQSNQWVDQINTASAATVEKEIAILLSEINYQLYLNRKIAERQLLTESITLLNGMGTSPVLQINNNGNN